MDMYSLGSGMLINATWAIVFLFLCMSEHTLHSKNLSRDFAMVKGN